MLGAMRTLTAYRVGPIRYAEAHSLQEKLVAARLAGTIGDVVLLLEHDPPVLTIGRGAKPEHLLFPPSSLRERGVEVEEAGRGGAVTYHGPGQLVGYPIVDLAPDRQDVRRYMRDLEEVMIRTARDFGVATERIDEKGYEGVWVKEPRAPERDRKIGAIGVRFSRWVTMHGFALNVAPNLGHYSLFVPCGITDKGVTSLERETASAPAMRDVETRAAEHLAAVLDAKLAWGVGRPEVAP